MFSWRFKRALGRLFKALIMPLLFLFFIVNIYCCYNALCGILPRYYSYYGFVGGLALYFVFRRLQRKNIDFLETYTHENIHVFVGLLFLQRIHSFSATSGGGGLITHSGKYANNAFIALAPYCLPLYTYILFIPRSIIVPGYLWIYDIIVGFTVGFHALAIKGDIRPDQSDIKSQGITFSYLFIGAFIFFGAAIILWAIPFGILGAFAKWWECVMVLATRVV